MNAEKTNPTNETHSGGAMGTVLCELDYGMDLANFIDLLGKHSLDLLHIGCEAKVASMGVSLNGMGQEIPAQ